MEDHDFVEVLCTKTMKRPSGGSRQKNKKNKK